jgi:hypothetical protein
VPLLDDKHWPARWREKLLGRARAAVHLSRVTWRSWMLEPLAGVAFFITALELVNTLRIDFQWPKLVHKLHAAVAPLRSFNSYGLFAVMTKSRPEIVIEGSNDGQNWVPYEFPWKIGDPWRRPRLAAPHQPRVDWQFWFAALGQAEQSPWLVMFMRRVLEGSPPVVALLEWNPFAAHPPKYLRAQLYEYHFTRFGEGGAWWKRELEGTFYGPVSLKPAPAASAPD